MAESRSRRLHPHGARSTISAKAESTTRRRRSMKMRSCALLLSLALAVPAFADDTNPYKVSVSTLITTPLVIEGLTNDNDGNVYAPGRATTAGQPCPVYKVNVASPQLKTVGQVPAPSAT